MTTPRDKVLGALPGTLTEIARATEYPVEFVLKWIRNLRAEGLRITARMGPSRNVPAKARPEPDSIETVFELSTLDRDGTIVIGVEYATPRKEG